MGGCSSHQRLQPLTIPINRVRCGESHMRRSGFYVESLKSTIQDAGLLQPILARRTGTSDFTVIDGARRLAALIELGVTELIVGRDVIIDIEETEADARFKQIIANVQREDFNAIELGHAFVTLKEEYGYQYNEIAEIVGKTPHYVTAKVGLAKRLEPEVQQLYIEDLEREKCIQNTFSAEALPGYVMNVNVLEDIARLPAILQKTAYVAVRAAEMDKGRALRYLRSLKKEGITAEAAESCAGEEKMRYYGVQRHISKISRDIERLVDTVSSGNSNIMEREAAIPEIEKLIEMLSALYLRIKISDAEMAEGIRV